MFLPCSSLKPGQDQIDHRAIGVTAFLRCSTGRVLKRNLQQVAVSSVVRITSTFSNIFTLGCRGNLLG